MWFTDHDTSNTSCLKTIGGKLKFGDLETRKTEIRQGIHWPFQDFKEKILDRSGLFLYKIIWYLYFTICDGLAIGRSYSSTGWLPVPHTVVWRADMKLPTNQLTSNLSHWTGRETERQAGEKNSQQKDRQEDKYIHQWYSLGALDTSRKGRSTLNALKALTSKPLCWIMESIWLMILKQRTKSDIQTIVLNKKKLMQLTHIQNMKYNFLL